VNLVTILGRASPEQRDEAPSWSAADRLAPTGASAYVG
jgi:hypothetical protein